MVRVDFGVQGRLSQTYDAEYPTEAMPCREGGCKYLEKWKFQEAARGQLIHWSIPCVEAFHAVRSRKHYSGGAFSEIRR
jgi:hypothetical protein